MMAEMSLKDWLNAFGFAAIVMFGSSVITALLIGFWVGLIYLLDG
jgi:hypothetical protein